MYLWEQPEWPTFSWDDQSLSTLLARVSREQGRLLGRMEALGFELRDEAHLRTLTEDVVKTSEIEGEELEPDQVRSSIARRLGMNVAGLIPSDQHVDGVVEMMLDATGNYEDPLTVERLFAWHAALFPTGRSGMQKINVGEWRDDSEGPMQVVSGPMGHETVHYEAPPAARIRDEVASFLCWFEEPGDGLVFGCIRGRRAGGRMRGERGILTGADFVAFSDLHARDRVGSKPHRRSCSSKIRRGLCPSRGCKSSLGSIDPRRCQLSSSRRQSPSVGWINR